MSTDDISEIWAADSKIDETQLAQEAKKIPQLHSKYYNMYYKEALKVKKLRYDYKILELNDLADDALKVLELNYPNHARVEEVKQTEVQ